MPSALDILKRALVSVLLEAARVYDLSLNLKRESPDQVLSTSYRKVMLRVHPDKPGGSESLAKRIIDAHSAWQEASKKPQAAGRPSGTTHGSVASTGGRKHKEYRVQSTAVLMTWQGFADVSWWAPFVDWLGGGLLFLAIL